MVRITEHDFSEVQKDEPAVRKIGKMGEISLYFSLYIEPNEILFGFKDKKLDYLIGNTEDLLIFEKALKLYEEHKNDRQSQRGY